MRRPYFAVAVLALTLACSDRTTIVAPTPRPTGLIAQSSCDPTTAIVPCDDGSDGGATFSGWPFFGPVNDLIYEAPGDPSPNAPGVWLGANVTPATCFNDRTRNIVDADHDWLDDRCELELARGFAPRWRMSRQDNCPDGEPSWAAKYFPNGGAVRIAFMPSYYDDCGHGIDGSEALGGAHRGDSEFAMVEVGFNPATQHWEYWTMWLSAHYGSSNDRSQWVGQSDATFSRRYLAHPSVEVSINKHANYKNFSKCQNTIGASFGFEDQCNSSDLDPFRFPIDPARNIGGRFGHLVDCVASIKLFAGNGRTECYWQLKNFRGWHPDGESGGSASAYIVMLGSPQFEFRNGDGGPGPAPASLVRATISGPTYVNEWKTYTWAAQPQNCNPTCAYQWRLISGSGTVTALGTAQSAAVNVGPALGQTFKLELTVSTWPKETVTTSISVYNDTYVPPPPGGCADPRQLVCDTGTGY